MGIEVVFGAISLAVGLASTAVSAINSGKALKAQKEAQNIGLAQGSIAAAGDRRQLLREERVRRAKILQGATNSGADGSSGESGALSAITTNVDTMISDSASQSKGNAGINSFNQKAANYDQAARDSLAWGEVFQSGAKSFGGIFQNNITETGNIWGIK